MAYREGTPKAVASVLTVSTDPKLSAAIKSGYESDPFCQKVMANLDSFPMIKVVDDLIFIGSRLVVPCVGMIWEDLF